MVAFSVVLSSSYVFVVIFVPYFATLERPELYQTLRTPQRQLQLFIYAYSNLFLAIIPLFGVYNSYPEDNTSKEVKNTSKEVKEVLEVESEYSYSGENINRVNPTFMDENAEEAQRNAYD